MNTNKFFNIFKLFSKSITALLIFTCFSISFLPQKSLAFVRSSSEMSEKLDNEDENFDKKFREGRDLIDKGDWAKAAEKFNEVINQYPDNKSVDAALYWLAFCHKKQRNFEKVGATVDRLLKDYPSSSWTSDARVLLIEVASSSPTVISGTAATGNSVTISGTYKPSSNQKAAQTTAIATSDNTFDSYSLFNYSYETSTKTPLDRQDEIKLAAFQSLLAADSQKGIQAMNDLLKSDSKASQTLKIEILRALRRPRTFNYITPLDLAKASSNVAITKSAEFSFAAQSQYSDALRDSLGKIFQNEPSIEIRKEIIYTLATFKNQQSTDYLAQLYGSENDKEVKKAIINGFGSSWGRFNGLFAARPTITTSGQNLSTTATITSVNDNSAVSTTPEFNKLLEIVRTEKDVELRRLALNNLQRFSGWEKNNQISEALIQIYDSEADENLKSSIIRSLGGLKQSQASKKLLDIAKNDKSDKLKLQAVQALGRSNDPEALKYLEEILK